MLYAFILLAGGCHNGACRLERPILERRVTKAAVVRVEKEVVRERRLQRLTIRKWAR